MFGDARSLDSEAVHVLCISLHILGSRFATLPSSSFGRQWSTARYPVFWQEIAWTGDYGFLIARTELRATTGNRTVRAYGRHPSGDAQTRRVARPRGHAESHPRIARHAANAGCSACFSSHTGVAAVELLNSEFAFCAFPLPESLRVSARLVPGHP